MKIIFLILKLDMSTLFSPKIGYRFLFQSVINDNLSGKSNFLFHERHYESGPIVYLGCKYIENELGLHIYDEDKLLSYLVILLNDDSLNLKE